METNSELSPAPAYPGPLLTVISRLNYQVFYPGTQAGCDVAPARVVTPIIDKPDIVS